MHSQNLVLILLITLAALLHPPGVLVSNSCSLPGFGEGPQDHPHAPFLVVYSIKGVAFRDVDCPPDKRQIHLTIPIPKVRTYVEIQISTYPMRLYLRP